MIKAQVDYVRFLDKYLNRQPELRPVFPIQLFEHVGFNYTDAEQQLEEYLKADEARTAEDFIDKGVLRVCCPFHFNVIVACDQVGLGEVALALNDYFDKVVLVTRSDQKIEYFCSLLALSASQKEKVHVIRVRSTLANLNFYQNLMEDPSTVAHLSSVLKVMSSSPALTI